MWAEAVVTADYTRNRTPVSAHGRTSVLRESDGRIMISPNVIFDEGEGDNGIVELSSDPTEGSPEAAGRSNTAHALAPAHEHAPATGRGRVARTISNSNQNGQVAKTVRESRAEPEEFAENLGMPTRAAQRYPPRERHTPGEWYCANLAADTEAEEHLKGMGEHPEPQSFQETVAGKENDLWRKSMDEEMRSQLQKGT
ncbi:hypothetical protein KFL_016390030 [Klebsormidium nitens]|uniref:Uncharacterized protein n=1 Tax=Klebsormidium nitens TaxID=105231 RepID=A0A1Y1IYY9_KLENI|nr:hypothetical protein KFL_016390030 [Klebsormidium nitens]|eukprot:GAQ93548.1 hypothetical protein KFL_016390030 [Klebsormidium nitens]